MGGCIRWSCYTAEPIEVDPPRRIAGFFVYQKLDYLSEARVTKKQWNAYYGDELIVIPCSPSETGTAQESPH